MTYFTNPYWYAAPAGATPTAYWAGGTTGADVVVAVNNGLVFATDTTTQTTRGALVSASSRGVGANSTSTGYFAGGDSIGGDPGSRITRVNGLTFATDTTAMVTKGALLTARTAFAAVESSTIAYFTGGWTGANAASDTSLTFASDTATQVTKGVLSTARRAHAGATSSTVGYFAGGLTGAGSVAVSTCEGLTYSSDTTTMTTRGALTTVQNDFMSYESSTLGYFMGGQTGAGSPITTNNGLTFASDTTAMVTKGVLSTARWVTTGACSTSTGYVSGGCTTTSARVTTSDGLSFASDTTTMVTKGALGTATKELVACQVK